MHELQFNDEIVDNYPVAANVPVVIRCVEFAIRHLLLSGFVICFEIIIQPQPKKLRQQLR